MASTAAATTASVARTDALHKWCADNGHIPTAVGWEHYGHWQEDAEQLQTMIAVVLQP